MKKNNFTTGGFTRPKIGNFSGGFTLIETMVSVLVLTVALSAFMTVVASSLFNARYANNEITANYLAQEVVDALHNDRDTFFQQQATNGGSGWYNFIQKYGYNNGVGAFCFDTTNGCQIEASSLLLCNNSDSCDDNNIVKQCSTTCSNLNYTSTPTSYGSFYTYEPYPTVSNFKRTVKMVRSSNYSGDQLDITVTIEWKNGSTTKSRVLKSSLTNWQQ